MAALEAPKFDLLDHQLFAEREPWDIFEYLQREAPVYRHPDDADGFWCVTKYDDVLDVLKRAKVFSSQAGGSARIGQVEPDVLEARRNFMETDAPLHNEWRKPFARDFTPKSIARYEDQLRVIVDQVLDEAFEKQDICFVHDIAALIPIRVLGTILGLPPEQFDRFIELGDRMIIDSDPEIAIHVAGSPEAEAFKYLPFGSEAAAELCAMGRQTIDARRGDPKEDVLSILANMEIGGHLLGDRDLDNNFALFVVAGNETTRQSMALGLLALFNDDRAMAEFSQPGAATDQAVDELIRIASPVWHFRRTAIEDTEIRGQEIKAGERVVIWFAAANRDAEAFENPHVLDFSRKKDEHLAFGRGGPHYCIGTHLARLEIRVLYEQLFPRLKSIEQTGPERRLVSNFTNGLKHFPVRITAK
ncbi:MAG: cytochrome P450 [Actinobacteria bacterium]|nr:cytochrome P450 [Actinomycetota bacterium]